MLFASVLASRTRRPADRSQSGARLWPPIRRPWRERCATVHRIRVPSADDGRSGPQRRSCTPAKPVITDQHVSMRSRWSGRRRPAGVTETQSAPAESGAMPRATPVPRADFATAASRCIENLANQLHPAVDVAADQELLGRAALQLDALAGCPRARRDEIRVSRFRRTAGIGKRMGRPSFHSTAAGDVGASDPARGCRTTPLDRRPARPRPSAARTAWMDAFRSRLHLGSDRRALPIVDPSRDERASDESVDAPLVGRRQLRGERFANPIVVGLDALG